jgi:hypothetical protein
MPPKITPQRRQLSRFTLVHDGFFLDSLIDAFAHFAI